MSFADLCCLALTTIAASARNFSQTCLDKLRGPSTLGSRQRKNKNLKQSKPEKGIPSVGLSMLISWPIRLAPRSSLIFRNAIVAICPLPLLSPPHEEPKPTDSSRQLFGLSMRHPIRLRCPHVSLPVVEPYYNLSCSTRSRADLSILNRRAALTESREQLVDTIAPLHDTRECGVRLSEDAAASQVSRIPSVVVGRCSGSRR